MSESVLIDVRGLKCPLPVLKTAKRMAPLAPGTRVSVLATDPMAAIDLPHFCNENGHRLIEADRAGDLMRFEIEKGPGADRSR
ncbi:sulfurtransferase TusA family protein [Faunimonas sp. B44]|uniref:sulfurtransferase TusA family protein n=1 Tax=Faunimonas sp. B44 TaxID=3461493 RepID=UPI004044EF84